MGVELQGQAQRGQAQRGQEGCREGEGGAGCSPARCSHWVSPAAVRSGPPGGSQMCPGEGACGPAARPRRSPWPCRAEQSSASPHTPVSTTPTRPWDGLELQRSRGGGHRWAQQASGDCRAGPPVDLSAGGFPWGSQAQATSLSWEQMPAPSPQTAPTRPPPSPHVDAGGLRGGAQQQLRGSVPADRSAHLTPGAPGRPQGTANRCSPPTGTSLSGARDVPGGRTADTTRPAFLGSSGHASSTWTQLPLLDSSCVHPRQHWVLGQAYCPPSHRRD